MKKQRLRFQYTSLILVLIYLLNLCVPCVCVRAEVTPLAVSLAEGEAFRDISGHWAEKEVAAWTVRGLANGYPDGTFRPDNPITRAEFLTLVNRAFGYMEMAAGQINTSAISVTPVTFSDVAETDWYAAEVAKAAAVGYLGGYPDRTMRPQNPITRQEVAAVLARILPLDVDSAQNDEDNLKDKASLSGINVLKGLTDQAQIPEWSQAAIGAAVNGGYMNGYPDGAFRPGQDITRAEALAVLNRAVGQLYNRAGTYGPFEGNLVQEGNVTITTSGVTLQNITVKGNLYLTEGIGAGDVTLINVTVQGTTKIAGGGSDSVHLRNTAVGAVVVHVPSRNLVRLLAQGSTTVDILEARTPVRLEEEGLTGAGFTKVRICSIPPVADSSVTVELLGQFNEVEIQPAQSAQSVQPAQFAQVNLSAQTVIENLIANAPVTVQGPGTVETTQANVDGVEIEAQAKNVFLADGVQTIVAGKTIAEDYKYTEPKKQKSRDAALSDLMINGTTVAGFAPDTLDYEIVLPYGTTEVPEVTATARHAKAKVAVTQATDLMAPDNIATIVVTAENGRTQTYTVRFADAESSEKTITDFCLYADLESEPVGIGVINEEANPKTITVTVPHGTAVTALIPVIIHTGASISPESGTTQDFSSPVTYIVTAEDGSTVEYVVTVNVALSSELSLSKFEIGGENVLGLGGINTPEGATLVVADFTGFQGIEVEAADHNATVTVALNDAELDGDLATQDIAANDVIVVEVVAADGETKGQYIVTVVQGYTVTYNENGSTGGSVPTDSRVYQEGETVTVLANTGTMVKEGYSFAGWNTTVDGSGIFYEADATFTMGTADVVLYAQWTIVDFAVDENNVFGTRATFTWSSAVGATSIAIQQSTDGGGNWENATTFEALSPSATSAVVTGLTKDTTYQFKLVVDSGITAGESNIIDITTKAAAMYGASWDSSVSSTSMTRLGDAIGATGKTTPAQIGPYFDGFAPWSGMKLCNVADDGTINAYIGEPSFVRDGSNGQVMVRIPKFYYKHTYDEATGKHEFWVAEWSSQAEAFLEAAGFKLHPAFIRAGVEKDYVLIGVYQAWLDEDSGKLFSISGEIPTTLKSIVDFRTAAQARGAGWNQLDIQTISAVQLLYLVEYATTNCQTSIGRGVVDIEWDSTIKAVATGGCDELAGESGVGNNSMVSYRGIENLWGNVWAFVDGINIKWSEKQPYVSDHDFVCDKFDENYKLTGITLPSAKGWIKKLSCSPVADWLFMPHGDDGVGGDPNSYIPDFYYENWVNPANTIVTVGQPWHHGHNAGLFGWSVFYTASTENMHVGARLVHIP
jgi:uncharacterized repeat protein (TIGR02543 family)